MSKATRRDKEVAAAIIALWTNDENLSDAVAEYREEIEARFKSIPSADAREDKWISVEERLPPENESVLVSNASGGCADETDPQIAHLEDGAWWYIAPWDYCLFSSAKVTHWMPLPASPATGKEE